MEKVGEALEIGYIENVRDPFGNCHMEKVGEAVEIGYTEKMRKPFGNCHMENVGAGALHERQAR